MDLNLGSHDRDSFVHDGLRNIPDALSPFQDDMPVQASLILNYVVDFISSDKISTVPEPTALEQPGGGK